MRHRNHSLRLSQKPHLARMMMRNMLTSLLLYERIRTTKKRAQVLKPMVDQTVNLGKLPRVDLAIRRINEVVTDDNACRKIIEVLKDRYKNRTGGFVKILPVGRRGGDGAKLVDVILIDAVFEPEEKSQKKQKSQKKSASSASSK